MERKNEKYIIAVDMDGTLLNSQGQVTKRTTETLQRLLDEGQYVVPASGRSLRLLPEAVFSLKGIPYAVLENGAVVWDWKNSKLLTCFPMPKGTWERILSDTDAFIESLDRDIRYFVEFFRQGEVYADQADLDYYHMADIPNNFADYMLSEHIYLENFREQRELLDQAEKLNLFFEDVELGRQVRQRWSQVPELSVTSSVPGDVEFNAKGVDKGMGLTSLMKALGVDREHVIAFGDSDNDLEMLKMAGVSVAMGNAADHVKASAAYTTADNDHDGVAVFLEKFFGM